MRRFLKRNLDALVWAFTTPLRAVTSTVLYGYIAFTIVTSNWAACIAAMAALVLWLGMLSLIEDWGRDVVEYEHDIAVRERAILSLLEHAQLRREGF